MTAIIYTPRLGEAIVPAIVERERRTAILNRPKPGTRMRAALGENVLVGTVVDQPALDGYPLIRLRMDAPDGTPYSSAMVISLYPESGWAFEILEEVGS